MKFLKPKSRNKKSGPDDYTEEMEDLTKELDQVDANNQEISRLTIVILNETQLEKIEAAKAKLHDKIEENKRLGIRIRSTLKQKNEDLANEENTALNNSNAKRIHQSQINIQSRRFYGLWTKYNEQMDEYKNKLKEMFRRQCRIANRNDLTDEDIETMLSDGNFEMFASLGETSKAQQQLRELEARHEDFVKLEKSIQEVYELFIELSAMVEDQGNSLDLIEMNIENTATNANEGAKNLKEARKKKKKTRKIKIISGAVVSVVVAIVIVVAVV